MLTFLGTTALSAWIAALGLLCSALWWWQREKRHVFSFPLLGFSPLPPSSRISGALCKPPWLYYSTFLALVLIWFLLSLRPTYWQHPHADDLSEQGSKNHLWIVDLSASVSAHISIEDYRALLRKSFQQIRGSNWHILFSHANQPILRNSSQPQTPEELFDHLSFHKPGFRLKTTLDFLASDLHHYHHISIFSDEDRFTWSDVNEDFLRSLPITLHNLTADALRQEESPIENFTIHSIEERSRKKMPQGFLWQGQVLLQRFVSAAKKAQQDTSQSAQGTLEVQTQSTVAASFDWHFLPQQHTLEVPVEFFMPQSGASTLLWPGQQEDPHPPPTALFTINPPSTDAVASDNTYAYPLHQPSRVLMVGSPLGERALEDPLRSVSRAFQALGYDTERWDGFPTTQASLQHVDLLLSFVNKGAENSRKACFFAEARAAHPPTAPSWMPPRIWLIPLTNPPHIKSLCLCTQRFYALYQSHNNTLSCKSSLSAEDFLAQLQTLGFKPLGGEVLSFHSAPFYATSLPSAPDTTLLLALEALNPFDHKPLHTSSPTAQSAPTPSHAFLTHGSLPFLLEELLDLTHSLLSQQSRLQNRSLSRHLTLLQVLRQSSGDGLRDVPGFSSRRAFLDITGALDFFKLESWPQGESYRLWHQIPLEESRLLTTASFRGQQEESQAVLSTEESSTTSSPPALNSSQLTETQHTEKVIFGFALLVVALLLTECIYGGWWFWRQKKRKISAY